MGGGGGSREREIVNEHIFSRVSIYDIGFAHQHLQEFFIQPWSLVYGGHTSGQLEPTAIPLQMFPELGLFLFAVPLG